MYFDISKLVSVANVQFALHFQSHKLFTIIPYKTDSKNFTSCRELQWKTEENFTSKLQKQCPLNIHIYIILYIYIYIYRWSGSSVFIATDYGLGDPGSNPGGDEIFPRPDRPWRPPSLQYNLYRVFSQGRVRPGACC